MLLDTATRIGGLLVVVGLVTMVVILLLYLTGSSTPGTWAYLLAMLAPFGFGLILTTLLVVAIRRRRETLSVGSPTRDVDGPGSDAPEAPAA